MKYHELHRYAQDELRHEARDLLTDIRTDIVLPLTISQKHSFRVRNYNIENDGEVTRIDRQGFIRVCYQGIPCTYLCGGLKDGKCSQYLKEDFDSFVLRKEGE